MKVNSGYQNIIGLNTQYKSNQNNGRVKYTENIIDPSKKLTMYSKPTNPPDLIGKYVKVK